MGGFFKTFGLGILYVILSPILVIIFSLYLIYSLLSYFFIEVYSLILFFRGKNIKGDDKETLKLLKVQEEIQQTQELAAKLIREKATETFANLDMEGDEDDE